MHTTTLRKVGGSVMLAVPPVLLEILRLQSGATVGLTAEGGRLLVEPRPRPRYTLDELLAQCDTAAEPDSDDQAWLNAKPVGRELLRWSAGTSTRSPSTRAPSTNSKAYAPSSSSRPPPSTP